MSTVAAPAENVNVLHGVTWETYERLLADRGENSRPLLTFDRGELEILSPGKYHERLARRITVLVAIISVEWGLEVADLGSTTFRHPGWERGFEADGCFYVGAAAHEADGTDEYEPDTDAVPNVVLEIDISRRSLSKDPLFAQFGIPELWRHDGSRAAILRLKAGEYRPATHSSAFPPLTADDLTALLASRDTTDSVTWARAVQVWAREHTPTS
jgi:Uma2 family endonuclease